HDLGLHLQGAQHRSGVGREERVAGAAGEDHQATLLEVPHHPPANVGLGERLHPDGGEHPRLDAVGLEHVLHRQGVDHGGEHSHVIRRDAIKTLLRGDRAADDVATADHQAQRDTRGVNRLDLVSERLDDLVVEASALRPGECLAGELEQCPAVACHQLSPTLKRTKLATLAPGTLATSWEMVTLSSLTNGCSISARSLANLRSLPSTILARIASGLPSAATCSSAMRRSRSIISPGMSAALTATGSAEAMCSAISRAIARASSPLAPSRATSTPTCELK